MSGTTDSRTVALELAAAHPDAALPCPECAASVKACNLGKHLSKVHPDAALRTRWAGQDHAIQIPALILGVASVAAGFAVAALDPVDFRLALVGPTVLLGVALALAALSMLGHLPASLTLEGDDLVLRYAFGVLRRRVRLPPRTVEIGGLVEHRQSNVVPVSVENRPGHDVNVGRYLRLRGDGGALTLGSKTGTGFTKHWAPQGWSAGGKRRRWHIVLPPSALVAVEYRLVAHGVLKVR